MTELLTTKEAASLLRCSPYTVNRYVRKGMLSPDKKVANGYLFERQKILRFKRPAPFMKSLNRASFKTKANHGLPEAEVMGIIEKWQVNSNDKASADVEIGVHTEKIMRIEVSLRSLSTEDPDFKLMRYKLLWHLVERRKLLHYLEISNYGRYRKAIALLEKEAQA